MLYVIDTLSMGGAEKSILAIASQLKNFTPVVCSLFADSTLLSQYQDAGVSVIQLKLPKTASNIRCAAALTKVIRKESPDIVHATLFRSEIVSRYALWFNNKTILVGSFVGDTYNDQRFAELGYFARKKLRLLQYLDRVTSGRVNAFMSISEFLKQSYISKLSINENKIVVIPRGRVIYPLKTAAPVRNDRLSFVAVGRLIKLKGHAELIRAFDLVRKIQPNISLEIAGAGPEEARLRALIEDLSLSDHVKLLGNVMDVPTLLSRCDVFVFASHYEGQGGALVEAMLAGKIIIASDIPVVQESITDQSTGLLFKVKDVQSLADRMKWVIDNVHESTRLAANARLTAVEKFDIQTTVFRHEELYRKLMSA